MYTIGNSISARVQKGIAQLQLLHKTGAKVTVHILKVITSTIFPLSLNTIHTIIGRHSILRNI